MHTLSEVPRLVVILLLGCFAALWAWVILHGGTGTPLHDVDAYWLAGQRVLAGQSPYTASTGLDRADVYRYAPWVAWLWAPLSALPKGLSYGIWEGLVVGTFAALIWAWRRTVAILLIAPLTLPAIWTGNIQTLMVFSLMVGLPTRFGPVLIAMAASIKGTPISLVLWYLGRREWKQASVAIAGSVLLVAPIANYDLSQYPLGSYPEVSLLGVSLFLWLAVGAAGAIVALVSAPTRFGLLTACITVVMTLPRLLLYDVSYLLVARAGRVEEPPGWEHGSTDPASLPRTHS